MKRLILCIMLGIAASAQGQQTNAQALHTRVDPRMELLSIVARLAEYGEYSECGDAILYENRVDTWFAPFKNHPAVEVARKMRRAKPYGLAYDAVFAFAIHLEIDGSTIHLNPALNYADNAALYSSRWNNEHTNDFVRELNDFYVVSKAAKFFAANAELYHEVENFEQQNVLSKVDKQWLSDFFGYAPQSLHLVNTLLGGRNNYGTALLDTLGVESAYACTGMFLDDNDQPTVNVGSEISLVIHEFTHSYEKSLHEKYLPKLQHEIAVIYEKMSDAIKSQSYSPEQAVFIEPMVRAVVILYDEQHDNNPQQALSQEKAEGFFFIDELVALLREYDANQSQYKAIEDFMPRIIEFYATLARA